jgi:hypothetical protein
MKTEDTKYEKVLKLLKEAKPDLKDMDIVTEKVMRQLKEEKSKIDPIEMIIEFLFGWIYVGWVRKSMVVAAVCMALLFGFQQVLILKKINELSGQRIQDGNLFMTSAKNEISDRIRVFRFSGRKLEDKKNSVSKKEIDEMIKSINKLQIKYKDIIDLIEDDPELKNYVETRMKVLEKIETKTTNYE